MIVERDSHGRDVRPITWLFRASGFAKKRREGFALVAIQLGMDHWPEDPFGLLSKPFALFNRGDGHGIENVIAGPYQSIDAKAFDYWYYEESTDSKGHTSRTYYRFDCVVVPIDAACSPLTIENENVLTRLADALSSTTSSSSPRTSTGCST